MPKKGRQNCRQQVWGTHEALTASGNFSAPKKRPKKRNLKIRSNKRDAVG